MGKLHRVLSRTQATGAIRRRQEALKRSGARRSHMLAKREEVGSRISIYVFKHCKRYKGKNKELPGRIRCSMGEDVNPLSCRGCQFAPGKINGYLFEKGKRNTLKSSIFIRRQDQYPIRAENLPLEGAI